MRVVVDQREGGGGFTSDQCIQLQGQMRDYLQLASQQYVVCFCDEVPLSPLNLVMSRNFTSLHHLRAELIFTRDIRHAGQMRDCLQLAAQQYVVCCCDEVPPPPKP